MKKLLIISAFLYSCSEGRWVGGNSLHFQQRHDYKLKQIKPNI